MAFVQNLGAKINPYTSYLPRGMQQSAQQQAGRQFLGGLAAPFLAAAGPSRYPMPTVAGLAGINPAIQSAQQTQNVALQNAMNAQKLQTLQMRQQMLKGLMGPPPQAPRPSANFAAPTAPLTIPPQLANTPQLGPSMTAFNTAMQQRAATPMARAGVPAAVTGRPVSPPGTNFMSAGIPQDAIRRAMVLSMLDMQPLATAELERFKPTTQARNAETLAAMPDQIPNAQGQMVPNPQKAALARMVTPPRRVQDPIVTSALKVNEPLRIQLGKDSLKAAKSVQGLNRMEAIGKKLKGNVFGTGDALSGLRRVGAFLGVEGMDELVSATDLIKSINTKLTLDLTGMLAGQISNYELQLLQSVPPGMRNTKRGFLVMIELHRSAYSKQVELQDHMSRWSATNREKLGVPGAYSRELNAKQVELSNRTDPELERRIAAFQPEETTL